jgi:hypothetical protein
MRERGSKGNGYYAARAVFTAIVVLAGSRVSSAQQDPAVLSGVQYLKGHYASKRVGESAMIALALLKAELPPNDPALLACLATVRSRFTTSTYEPDLRGGPEIYEASAATMALASEDAATNRGSIGLLAAYILSKQKANGSWDYNHRTNGDCSISQYAVLGLWEAENAGVDIAPSAWDRAASWYMSMQSSAGSWSYHRDEATSPETLSMTAAGTGSLLICKRQLEKYRRDRRGTSTLLKAIGQESAFTEYRPSVTNAQLDAAIKRGMNWISANFTTGNSGIIGQTPYYMLYGLERIGALSDRETIGRLDWYEKGRSFIHSSQQGDGSWKGAFGAEMNTVWAILFVTKSTAKTIQRVKVTKLGAGTLLGGRNLPSDLSSLTVAGGRVVSRPLNGQVEGMLAILEDPRAEQADAAAAGVVERYYREGASALRPFKPRFHKMLTDRDQGVRRVAAWALAHTGDLDVVPALIEALLDPDQDVVTAATLGLQLLSRKIDGFGPPSPSTPEQRKAAVERWRAWYQAIRPLDLEGQDDGPDMANASPAPNSGNANARSSTP